MRLACPSQKCFGLAHLEGMLSGDGPGSVAVVIDAIAEGLHARDEGGEGQSGIRDLQRSTLLFRVSIMHPVFLPVMSEDGTQR